MPSRPDPQDTAHGSHSGHGHSLPAGPDADHALTGRGGSTRRRVITALTAILVPLTLAMIAGCLFAGAVRLRTAGLLGAAATAVAVVVE